MVFLGNFRRTLLMDEHTCPWWLAYAFDHRIRRLIHKPERILKPYVKPGMTVVDIGCGMGFFSIGMAQLVEEGGTVLSVDLQKQMLEILERRARHAGVAHRISTYLSTPDEIGVSRKSDFALTFWMVHEVRNEESFLRQVYKLLKPSAKYLLVEPKIHTSSRRFENLVHFCKKCGFQIVENPNIRLSRSALFQK